MKLSDAIPEIKVPTVCKLYPYNTYNIIVPLLGGRAWEINRCEHCAGESEVCQQCAVEVSARAEQIYQELPPHLKR